jgi:formylglycine-generating enzyme required for sulfatase activity
MRRLALLAALGASAFAITYGVTPRNQRERAAIADTASEALVWVPGGEFTRGRDCSVFRRCGSQWRQVKLISFTMHQARARIRR